VRVFHSVSIPADAIIPGHFRLWVKGIYHGDISPKNLMYGVSAKTGDPVGILNDFDLATWVGNSTMNNDRTGTVPFMAIDLLDGGLDRRIPRLYRHDLESFVWVLAYITVAKIEYSVDIKNKKCTIKTSPKKGIDAWFKDGAADRDAHVTSKWGFHSRYGTTPTVFSGYHHYCSVVGHVIRYWSDFHQSLLRKRGSTQPQVPGMAAVRVVYESDTDNPTPAESLGSFIEEVERELGEDQFGFAEIKALREAIVTPVL
jgi:serine/threonine protein kinase